MCNLRDKMDEMKDMLSVDDLRGAILVCTLLDNQKDEKKKEEIIKFFVLMKPDWLKMKADCLRNCEQRDCKHKHK